MNQLVSELDAALASYVPTEKHREDHERAMRQHDDFVVKFPVEGLDKLTPEMYCIGRGDRENFCWWVERGTNALSNYFPGSSKSYGMFWEKDKGEYSFTAEVLKYKKEHQDASEAEILCKTITTPVKRLVESHGGNGTFEAVHTIGKSMMLKLLILYYPDEFMPVNSTAWIDRMLDAYELPKLDSYVERNKTLRRFYEEKRSLVGSGDITPGTFVGVMARHLKLVDPSFWHMQLHPTGKAKMSREDVLTIINDYGVIGMGEEWDNDGGQPRHFAEEVQVGDVIGIREGGFVALVRVSGPCVANKKRNNLNWFGIVRPVELLSDNAEPYMERYKEKTGLGAHDNLYNPATLSKVKPNCKNKFLKFWYDSLLDRMDVSDGEGSRGSSLSTVSLQAEVYDKKRFLENVFMDEHQYRELVALLSEKKNLIFTGAPGVGKTFVAKRLAWSMMGGKFADRIGFVQFHQSYSYEDFVCGYRPVGGGGFSLEDGAFLGFCRKAAADPSHDFFFIIDEINRGNVSKIFGELLMAIEADKRGDADYGVRLAYKSDETFVVPENVYIIGMMNTADRSLAMMDYALRRRFSFYSIEPKFDAPGFKSFLNGRPEMKRLAEAVKSLNERISADPSLGEGFVIGHSYFCGGLSAEQIVRYDIAPTLNEYWFDNRGRAVEETGRLLGALR